MRNRYLPHVLIIPEDDANRQIANGFLLNHSVDTGRIQLEVEAGGWSHALAQFKRVYVPEMNKWEQRFILLLIDFDEDGNRFKEAQSAIPENLRNRVFVLGAWSNPERLRAELGASFERIGGLMAVECEKGDGIWVHPLLRHNANELDRLRKLVCPFLFFGH
jgi:hypothetical protein